MGLIKCPECGKEISDMAQSCPNCGRPLNTQQGAGVNQGPNMGPGVPPVYQGPAQPPKKKGHGCLITVLILFITFVLFVVFMVMGTQTLNDSIQREVSGATSEEEYITLEEYNKIDTGMSYEDVQTIVGSPGTITSQVESNGIKIIIVTWYGDGVAGSNANVTFTNDAVTGKAQIGLK